VEGTGASAADTGADMEGAVTADGQLGSAITRRLTGSF